MDADHQTSDCDSEDYVYKEGDYDSSAEWDEYEDGDYFNLHIFTIRKELLRPLRDHLNDCLSPMEAFLSACQELPGVQGLADLKRLHPTALPSWLAQDQTSNPLRYLEVHAGNHVRVSSALDYVDASTRAAERKAQLKRFKRCRFKEGFASEGMLCNSPPLPLRLLDYLEAADLLSLSLVCKATHRASHYLFQREEEVLKRRDIVAPALRRVSRKSLSYRYHDAAARHRAMRVASLMCGRPEAVDVTSKHPSLLHNLVAAPGTCTQPHVCWELWRRPIRRLSQLLDTSRLKTMGSFWVVDPEGWPSRDQGALAMLKRAYDGENVYHPALHEGLLPQAPTLHGARLMEVVGRVAEVFEAAREHKQPLLLYQDWEYLYQDWEYPDL